MIQILTISGRLIKTIQTIESSNNQRIGPITWDGKDDYGDSIGKGVYIYNVSVENTNGDKVSKLQKLVILK
jgi:flagellar hook assembly protein FlgD